MTREKAQKELWSMFPDSLVTENGYYNVEKLIHKIYDDFEQQLANLNSNLEAQEIMIADYKKRIEELEVPNGCDGCIHEPLQGENYYDPCGQCKRFYGDFYEQNKDKL